MAKGIKDKVAILGMGCSKFGERWNASPEDLMVEAYTEAMADAGIFDAAAVLEAAVHSAISTAAMALTTDVMVHRRATGDAMMTGKP